MGGAFRIIGGSDAGVYYRHTDHLNSTSVLSDSTGQKVNGSDVVYAPFGEVRTGSQSDLTDFGYTGQRSDASTDGLMYYGARYYLPELRRFISADTIVPGAGNPQAFNRYAYVINNPMRFTDPSGHAYIMDQEEWNFISQAKTTSSGSAPLTQPRLITQQEADKFDPVVVSGLAVAMHWATQEGVSFDSGDKPMYERSRGGGAKFTKLIEGMTAFEMQKHALGGSERAQAILGFNKTNDLYILRIGQTSGPNIAGNPCCFANGEYNGVVIHPDRGSMSTFIHESGHVIDQRASGCNAGVFASASTICSGNAFEGMPYWTSTSEGWSYSGPKVGSGAPTLYSIDRDPMEDFAETYTWFVCNANSMSCPGFDNRPDPQRLQALQDILNIAANSQP
jgi:RHS repeat-associated protein